MTIQATDVVEQLETPPSAPVAPAQEEELPREERNVPPAAPRARGRPAGSKDKQPRKRPARAAASRSAARAQLAWAEEEEEEEEEEPQQLRERPPTRRSAPPKSSAPRRRVRIVESASEASSAEEEQEEAPSPRTERHRQWAVYRQQRTDAHQANVNRYAALFDRMLA